MLEFLKGLFRPERVEPRNTPLSGGRYTDFSQPTFFDKTYLKCEVCGCVYAPLKCDHYVAVSEPKAYDAFNCPICGCQIIAHERKRNLGKDGACTCR